MTVPAAAQDMVRAKIGIELISGKSSTRARTIDRIKTGDKLRIYVIPEQNAYVYIVHTDQNKVTLFHNSKVNKDATLILPSSNQYFLTDGLSETEVFTIICSLDELTNIMTLLSSKNLSYSIWAELGKNLLKKKRN